MMATTVPQAIERRKKHVRKFAGGDRGSVRDQVRHTIELEAMRQVELVEDDPNWELLTLEEQFAKKARQIDLIVRGLMRRASVSDRAAEHVLDRLVGKPKQEIEADVRLSHEDWLEKLGE